MCTLLTAKVSCAALGEGVVSSYAANRYLPLWVSGLCMPFVNL